MNIEQLESRVLMLIDDMVEHASENELFASGYLRGHVSLAMVEVEKQGEQSAAALKKQVLVSLDKAIAMGELSPPDQVLVQQIYERLFCAAFLSE